jgi:GNAT superfamily N-acetyltransferase
MVLRIPTIVLGFDHPGLEPQRFKIEVRRRNLIAYITANIVYDDMTETIATLVLSKVSGEWCISSILVDPNFRHHGIAKNLLMRGVLEFGTLKTARSMPRVAKNFMEHLVETGNATPDGVRYKLHFNADAHIN